MRYLLVIALLTVGCGDDPLRPSPPPDPPPAPSAPVCYAYSAYRNAYLIVPCE